MTTTILPSHTTHKFPWINTAAKTVMYLLKNRIKAPRVVPAPSTGDQSVDDTTRREFERVREQLTADYNDQRAALTDLEPLIYQLAEQVQGFMSENETRMADREERMMNMILMHSRGQQPGIVHVNNAPGLPAHGTPGQVYVPAPGTPSQQPAEPVSPYEGQLLRGDGTAPVYKIENGRKRWIVTEQSLLANGFSWAQVRVVPRAIVDALPAGSNIV